MREVEREVYLRLECPLKKLLNPSLSTFSFVCVQIWYVERPQSGSAEPGPGMHREMISTERRRVSGVGALIIRELSGGPNV